MTRRRSMAPASSSSSPALSSRHLANLGDGPTGLIAERLLAHDVADYLRFRAVCVSWRFYSEDPQAYGFLDRRFHPRRWILLLETDVAHHRRRFLNLSTGECIKVRLPELRDHTVLAQTCEGLLVLLHDDGTHVRLLNPLTRRLIQLPPLTRLLPKKEQEHQLLGSPVSDVYFAAWGSGFLDDDDDSTLVLSFNSLDMLGVVKLKPGDGDARWTLLRFHNSMQTTSSMFAGRFYCVNEYGVMVLKKDQPWRLEVAAKLHNLRVSPTVDSLHLVESAGELMLVHRSFSPKRNYFGRRKYEYDVYRVDLGAGTACPVNSLPGDGGGHALFLGMRCSLSVPIGVFPAGSISGDTIYLRFDFDERDETECCHLVDGSTTPSVRYHQHIHLVAQPRTLVDCLSLCGSGYETL